MMEHLPARSGGPVVLSAGTDTSWFDEIVSSCPSLRSGCRPPLWARNGHVQAALTLLLDDGAPEMAWDADERITLDDGGTVSLQWSGLNEAPDTPVLVVLHTICGSGHSLRRFIRSMRRRLGWVVVACNRRGHADLPLTAPRINTMGFVDDLEKQIDRIAERRPQASLHATGISAGSGLLVRYLGETGDRSRFRSAVAVCPAYDIPEGLGHAHPAYDAYMARKMVRFFLTRHQRVLGEIQGFEHCAASRTMLEFHDRLYPLAGYPDISAYNEASNPMRVADHVRTPLLVLNTEDDPICSVANVTRNRRRMQSLPRILTALTRYGGHCGFYEGRHGEDSWSDRAIAEYLEASQRL